MKYTEKIGFRNLQGQDLHMLHKWLNVNFVMQWYGKKPISFQEVENKYMKRIETKSLVKCFIILHEDNAIGFIQMYKISDFPDYAKHIAVDENASGIDLFIGEADYIHKGLGQHIISKFLEDKVFRLTDSVSCIIGPEPKNAAAIRAYEKVGFRYIKTVEISEEETEYIMRIDKDDFLAGGNNYDCKFR